MTAFLPACLATNWFLSALHFLSALRRSVCTQDIVDMLGYMSLRNSSEATTFFERDKMVKVGKE